jgi:hypothetical protein
MSNTFPLVEVSGSSYEMGYRHGAQAADLVGRYILWIEKLTRISGDALSQNAMALLPIVYFPPHTLQ